MTSTSSDNASIRDLYIFSIDLILAVCTANVISMSAIAIVLSVSMIGYFLILSSAASRCLRAMLTYRRHSSKPISLLL